MTEITKRAGLERCNASSSQRAYRDGQVIVEEGKQGERELGGSQPWQLVNHWASFDHVGKD